MSAWIRLIASMDGLNQVKRQQKLTRGLIACALAAPLLMAGCTKTTEASYRIPAGQKDMALTLDSDVYNLTFF